MGPDHCPGQLCCGGWSGITVTDSSCMNACGNLYQYCSGAPGTCLSGTCNNAWHLGPEWYFCSP